MTMKLYDQVRYKLRFLHYSLDTEKSYLRWIDQYQHVRVGRPPAYAKRVSMAPTPRYPACRTPYGSPKQHATPLATNPPKVRPFGVRTEHARTVPPTDPILYRHSPVARSRKVRAL